MKKLILALLGCTALSLAASPASAEDKILSPLGNWDVQSVPGQVSSCTIANSYENGLTINMFGKQSRLQEISLTLEGGGFSSGESYPVVISVLPTYNAQLTGTALSENEITLDVASDLQIMSALKQGQIAYITINDMRHGISLSGIGDGMRRLQTCRDSTNLRAAKQVYDFDAVAKEESYAEQGSEIAGAPIAINPFPLQGGTPNTEIAAAPEAPPEGEFETVTVAAAEDVQMFDAQIAPPQSASLKSAPDYVVETETTEIEQGVKNPVVDLASSDNPQAVIEPIKTITRVHTPKVTLKPEMAEMNAEEVLSSEPLSAPDTNLEHAAQDEFDFAMNGAKEAARPAEIIAPKTQNVNLAKPPVFDPPPVDELVAVVDDNLANSSDPIENRNAVMANSAQKKVLSAEEGVTRLARKNDYNEEILWRDNAASTGEAYQPQLAQSAAQAIKAPVVIPKIPESDLPSRIDLMKQNNAPATNAAPEPHVIRPVDNEMLEEQIKGQTKEAFRESLQETAYTESAPTIESSRKIESAPIVSRSNIIPAQEPAMQAKWLADGGANLREVIANWSITEGVELIWDSNLQYSVLQPLSMDDSYERAIAQLLNQYTQSGASSRPVGQLYVDPESGEKVLIIQSEGS